MKMFLLASAAITTLAACARKEDDAPPADASYAETLMAQLIDAKSGDVITIPEGRFSFDRSLSLNVDGVTIRGAGMEKTVLSFKGQVAGAEGLLVTADDFTIEDLAIEDTKGDALKIAESENVIIRRVRTEWTGEPRTENGAYGIYPVQVRNLLMEDSVAIGASDAGLYIGQSQNVVIRNNRAERNVAGIEIENTTGADVYGNVATDNTGGILVFNMPNLSQPGAGTRVYGNRIYENNRKNFGLPGTAVASVPAGSGVVINANDDVEIFDNEIRDNKTGNVIVASIFSSGISTDGMQADFDPYAEGIFVYDNTFDGGGDNPDGVELQALKLLVVGPLGRFPDIIWDGYVAPTLSGPSDVLCVRNEGVKVLNVDSPNDNKSPKITEGAPHDCDFEKLPAIRLDGPLASL